MLEPYSVRSEPEANGVTDDDAVEERCQYIGEVFLYGSKDGDGFVDQTRTGWSHRDFQANQWADVRIV
jgi:hypothetical protein